MEKYYAETRRKTQVRTYRDVIDDKTSSLKEKGWKVGKDCYKVDDDLLVYRWTLYCKWRDVCDCNATTKIESLRVAGIILLTPRD